jgi:hypothetical protein
MKHSQSFWFYDLDSLEDILTNLNWDLPGLRPGKTGTCQKRPSPSFENRKRNRLRRSR